jgi:hypothetical protein
VGRRRPRDSDELGTVIRLGTIPPQAVADETLHFRPAIAVGSCYAGPVEEGEQAVRALRRFGTPLADLVEPRQYVDHQSAIDDTVPHGWHYYWKAANLDDLSDAVIDIVAEHAYRASSPRSYAAMFHLGGAVARVPRGATAYPSRDVAHNTSSTRHGFPNRTTPLARRRPRGHGRSSTPSNRIVSVST